MKSCEELRIDGTIAIVIVLTECHYWKWHGEKAKGFRCNQSDGSFTNILSGVFGVGRVLNAKTARSQLSGGVVWGIGQALHEEAVMDEIAMGISLITTWANVTSQ